MTELVHVEKDRGIARITLDSPHNRNALSLQLVTELLAALKDAEAAADVRAVVLTATGPTFCAGADLKEAKELLEVRAERTVQVFAQLGLQRQPVLVELNGDARAGGLGILGAADMVVAPRTATFAFSEVRIGVVPAMIAVILMPRLNPRASQRYFLTGESFSADEAARMGLITASVEPAEVRSSVDSLLEHLRKGSPTALGLTKKFLREHAGKPVDEGTLKSAADFSAAVFASEEAQEGMRAFREKRPPRWVL